MLLTVANLFLRREYCDNRPFWCNTVFSKYCMIVYMAPGWTLDVRNGACNVRNVT